MVHTIGFGLSWTPQLSPSIASLAVIFYYGHSACHGRVEETHYLQSVHRDKITPVSQASVVHIAVGVGCPLHGHSDQGNSGTGQMMDISLGTVEASSASDKGLWH